MTGSGSLLSNSANTYVGYVNGAGNPAGSSYGNSLTVSNGGEVIDANGYVGFATNGSTGGPISTNNSALVTGSGSLWSNSSSLIIGDYISSGSNNGSVSNNSLTISNGGEVIDAIGIIGSGNKAKGNSVLVTGAGSLWSNSSTLALFAGNSPIGDSTLTLADGGSVAAASLSLAAVHAPGTLNIGSLGGSDTAGVLSIGRSTITITGNTNAYPGTINFNQSDTFTLSNAISSGYALINQFGSGTTILSANNNNSGITTVTNGTLLAENISGSAVGTGTVVVTNAGTLGGNGIIGGAATNANGGNLVPGVSGVGALSFTNGLTLATGSTTTFLINATNSFTSINLIGKTLTNGGALTFNITSYTAEVGDTFTVFNMTSGAAESGDFSSVEVGSTFLSDASGTWTGTNNFGDTYVYTDSLGQLAVTSVPEPSTYALLALGVLALVIAWRRRSFGSA